MKTNDILNNIDDNYVCVENWIEQVDNIFPNRQSGYFSIEYDIISIENNSGKYVFPSRITFSDNVINENQICNQEYILDNNQTRINLNRNIYRLSFYKRDNKIPFTGGTSDILLDVFKEQSVDFKSVYISKEIESYNGNLLYSINSNIKWSSYVLLFKGEIQDIAEPLDISVDANRVLQDLGLNMSLDKGMQFCVFVIFPIPYIKICENRIVKNDEGMESVFIVLEKNSIRWKSNLKNQISIKSIIKNTKNEIIDEGEVIMDNKDSSRFKFVTLMPKIKQEIGYSEIRVYVDNVLVDIHSGYYIRSIKMNINVK